MKYISAKNRLFLLYKIKIVLPITDWADYKNLVILPVIKILLLLFLPSWWLF